MKRIIAEIHKSLINNNWTFFETDSFILSNVDDFALILYQNKINNTFSFYDLEKILKNIHNRFSISKAFKMILTNDSNLLLNDSFFEELYSSRISHESTSLFFFKYEKYVKNLFYNNSFDIRLLKVENCNLFLQYQLFSILIKYNRRQLFSEYIDSKIIIDHVPEHMLFLLSNIVNLNSTHYFIADLKNTLISRGFNLQDITDRELNILFKAYLKLIFVDNLYDDVDFKNKLEESEIHYSKYNFLDLYNSNLIHMYFSSNSHFLDNKIELLLNTIILENECFVHDIRVYAIENEKNSNLSIRKYKNIYLKMKKLKELNLEELFSFRFNRQFFTTKSRLLTRHELSKNLIQEFLPMRGVGAVLNLTEKLSLFFNEQILEYYNDDSAFFDLNEDNKDLLRLQISF